MNLNLASSGHVDAMVYEVIKKVKWGYLAILWAGLHGPNTYSEVNSAGLLGHGQCNPHYGHVAPPTQIHKI